MKRSLFNQWIEALRSGEYSQTHLELRCGDGFCCLGVLGDVHPEAYWDDENLYQPLPGCDGIDIACHNTELTEDFLRVLNLPNRTQNALVTMNDDACQSFDEIADHLESIAGSKDLPIEEDT